MARGYSATRSKSGRPTLKAKRRRSLSLQNLKEVIDRAHSKGREASVAGGGVPAKPLAGGVRISRMGSEKPRQPSAAETPARGGPDAGGRKKRMRSQSTIRQSIVEMENELDLEDSEDEKETVAHPDVQTKYKSAGRAVDEVLDLLVAAAVPGAHTKALCAMGDEELLARVKGMFSKAKGKDGQKILRGLSYPTNVSVNHVLCNHTPASEEHAHVLQAGDVVKIHLGCHIDGFPVSAARTMCVPSGTGSAPRPDVPLHSARNTVEAARVALLGMIHMMRPGTLNADVTDFIHRVGVAFGVEPVEGVLSNRTKRWVPDGMNCIITRRVTSEDPQQDVGDCKIGENQVWTLDVAFTNSPSYHASPVLEQINIFRKNELEPAQDPRLRAANAALQKVAAEFQCFPFNVNHLENPLQMRMGVALLKKIGLFDELAPLQTKKGKAADGAPAINARFSATVSISGRRITVLCGLPTEAPQVIQGGAPTAIPDDIAVVLAEPLDFHAASQQALRQKKQALTAAATTVSTQNANANEAEAATETEAHVGAATQKLVSAPARKKLRREK